MSSLVSVSVSKSITCVKYDNTGEVVGEYFPDPLNSCYLLYKLQNASHHLKLANEKHKTELLILISEELEKYEKKYLKLFIYFHY